MSDQWSALLIPGTSTLKNKLGIVEESLLDGAEDDIVEARAQQLLTSPVLSQNLALDLDGLKRVHQHLFGDVYDWAGQTRSFTLRKNDTDFAHPAKIGAVVDKACSELDPQRWSRAALRSQSRARSNAVHDVSRAFGWLNWAHPFREGNGRSTRAFLRLALRQRGLDLDMSRTNRPQLVRASILTTPKQGSLGRIDTSPKAAAEMFDRVIIDRVLPIETIDELRIRAIVNACTAQAVPETRPQSAPQQNFASQGRAQPSHRPKPMSRVLSDREAKAPTRRTWSSREHIPPADHDYQPGD